MKKIISLVLVLSFLHINCSYDEGDSPQNTINGSYSKIMIINNYLYAINESTMVTYDVTNPEIPVEIDKQEVGFMIENIFHQNGVLFIGSQSALHIFEIDDKGIPRRKNETRYFRDDNVTSCDPVIVRGDYAYVTLSTLIDGNCGRFTNVNELRIYDISDFNNPVRVRILPLEHPKGLSIDGDILFVCEAKKGVKVIDVSSPFAPVVLSSIEEFESYDVIAKNGLLMVVCPHEIRQYNYEDMNNISLVSVLNL